MEYGVSSPITKQRLRDSQIENESRMKSRQKNQELKNEMGNSLLMSQSPSQDELRQNQHEPQANSQNANFQVTLSKSHSNEALSKQEDKISDRTNLNLTHRGLEFTLQDFLKMRAYIHQKIEQVMAGSAVFKRVMPGKIFNDLTVFSGIAN